VAIGGSNKRKLSLFRKDPQSSGHQIDKEDKLKGLLFDKGDPQSSAWINERK